MTKKKKIFIGIGVVAVIAFVVFNLYIMFGYGFESRARVNEAITAAQPMREAIMKFRVDNGRWPEPADAGRFRLDRSKLGTARSIAYDPALKAVVITMDPTPYEGRSFLFAGEDRDGVPRWTCRRVDIDAKYMPASCR